MDLGEKELQDGRPAPKRSRRVSRALFIGVLLMPVIFVWFLMRRGYSTTAQAIGVAWLGVIGVVLLLSAPRSLVSSAPPSVVDGSPRAWETQSAAPEPSALHFKFDQTRSINRMLATSVTLTNNVGRDLKYVEVFCSYHDAAGALLGYGMSNWSTVKAGDTVTGQVVASGVAIDDVRRRDCRARHL